MHISVSFTKKEFNELLTLTSIGEYVRDGVLEDRGEYKGHEVESLIQKLYDEAVKHKIPGIETTDLDGMKYTGPTNEREEEEHAWIEEHDEENFWETLSTRLGRRDFFNNMTPEDKIEMENTGWLPKTIQTYFERYGHEFETYGLERVAIDENASVPSDLLLEQD